MFPTPFLVVSYTCERESCGEGGSGGERSGIEGRKRVRKRGAVGWEEGVEGVGVWHGNFKRGCGEEGVEHGERE